VNRARPDLWEPRGGNDPGPPDPGSGESNIIANTTPGRPGKSRLSRSLQVTGQARITPVGVGVGVRGYNAVRGHLIARRRCGAGSPSIVLSNA
jgi:hypothetical protein